MAGCVVGDKLKWVVLWELIGGDGRDVVWEVCGGGEGWRGRGEEEEWIWGGEGEEERGDGVCGVSRDHKGGAKAFLGVCGL